MKNPFEYVFNSYQFEIYIHEPDGYYSVSVEADMWDSHSMYNIFLNTIKRINPRQLYELKETQETIAKTVTSMIML